MVLGGTFLGITALGLTLARITRPRTAAAGSGRHDIRFRSRFRGRPAVAGRVIDVSQDFSPALLAAAVCLGLSAFMSSLSGWMGNAEVKTRGKA